MRRRHSRDAYVSACQLLCLWISQSALLVSYDTNTISSSCLRPARTYRTARAVRSTVVYLLRAMLSSSLINAQRDERHRFHWRILRFVRVGDRLVRVLVRLRVVLVQPPVEVARCAQVKELRMMRRLIAPTARLVVCSLSPNQRERIEPVAPAPPPASGLRAIRHEAALVMMLQRRTVPCASRAQRRRR